jgi:hypothetical protein
MMGCCRILPKKNAMYCLFEIKIKGLKLKPMETIKHLSPKKFSLRLWLPFAFGF